MTLPDTIALNDTALLNAMMKESITIDDLLASGEYKFGSDSGAAYFKEAESVAEPTPAKTKTKKSTSGADSMQGGLF